MSVVISALLREQLRLGRWCKMIPSSAIFPATLRDDVYVMLSFAVNAGFFFGVNQADRGGRPRGDSAPTELTSRGKNPEGT